VLKVGRAEFDSLVESNYLFIFIYLFFLRNQYTKMYERKDRKHRKAGNC